MSARFIKKSQLTEGKIIYLNIWHYFAIVYVSNQALLSFIAVINFVLIYWSYKCWSWIALWPSLVWKTGSQSSKVHGLKELLFFFFPAKNTNPIHNIPLKNRFYTSCWCHIQPAQLFDKRFCLLCRTIKATKLITLKIQQRCFHLRRQCLPNSPQRNRKTSFADWKCKTTCYKLLLRWAYAFCF